MNDLSNNLLISKNDSKRERKHNAIKLPLEINNSMIPKYVVYYKECYNKEHQQFREFFKIEKHPKNINKKTYTSSKSTKIGILEKLAQIKELLTKLDNEQYTCEPNSKLYQLPKYVSLKKGLDNDETYYLIYDKKTNDTRYTCKSLYNNNYQLSKNMELFLEKISNKYKQ